MNRARASRPALLHSKECTQLSLTIFRDACEGEEGSDQLHQGLDSISAGPNQPAGLSFLVVYDPEEGGVPTEKKRERGKITRERAESDARQNSLSLLTQRVKKSFSMKRRPNPRVHQLSFFLLLLWPSSSSAAAFFGRLFGPRRRVGECHPCACLQCRAVTSRDMKSPLSFSLLLAWPPF